MNSSLINLFSYSTDHMLIPCAHSHDPGCKKMPMSRFSFGGHKLIHTKEKKIKCKVCRKSFAFAQHLHEHSYRHLNLKLYKCEINGCLEIFRHSNEFSIHRRTHPEYTLKRCRYVRKVWDKEAGKILKRRYKRRLTIKTADNMESLITEEQTGTPLEVPRQSSFDLDMKGLNCQYPLFGR